MTVETPESIQETISKEEFLNGINQTQTYGPILWDKADSSKLVYWTFWDFGLDRYKLLAIHTSFNSSWQPKYLVLLQKGTDWPVSTISWNDFSSEKYTAWTNSGHNQSKSFERPSKRTVEELYPDQIIWGNTVNTIEEMYQSFLDYANSNTSRSTAVSRIFANNLTGIVSKQ